MLNFKHLLFIVYVQISISHATQRTIFYMPLKAYYLEKKKEQRSVRQKAYFLHFLTNEHTQRIFSVINRQRRQTEKQGSYQTCALGISKLVEAAVTKRSFCHVVGVTKFSCELTNAKIYLILYQKLHLFISYELYEIKWLHMSLFVNLVDCIH